jgi:hypothetical protein
MLSHPCGGAHLPACLILDEGARHQPTRKMRPTGRRRGGVDARGETVVALAAHGYENEGGEN